MLSVRDEYAGKTGKCPSCGATMNIPYPGEAIEPGARPSRSRPDRYQDEDYPPRGARSRRPGPDDDYDEYDDRRGSRYDESRGRRRTREPFVGTLVCLGIGIGLLLFLGLTPLFNYAGVSAKAGNLNIPGGNLGGSQASPSLFKGDKDFDGGWQGKVILIVTLLIAVFSAVCLILYLTINPAASDLITTISGCIAGAWSITVAFWYVGFIWKVFTFSSKFKEFFGGRNNPFGGTIEVSVSPGIGLWFGLVAALGAVGVFSTLMTLRGKTLWIYLAEGIGLLLGILLMLVAVRPWKTPFDNLPGAGGKPFMQKLVDDRSFLARQIDSCTTIWTITPTSDGI
jgi:hypothetical protein